MALALVFPGQGSQDVGMGQALSEAFPIARDVFAEVDDALGQSLSKLMFDGPKDELILTENSQPALMAHSVAVVRVLEREHGFSVASAAYVAGHSLGEYSALAAAGALGLADTARLLKKRGRAMQDAVALGDGAMSAILGLDLGGVEAIAREAAQGDVCEIANDNDPAQIVLSGHKRALDRVPDIAKAHGARRAVPLPVSAPFHCSLMQPAADVMAEALGEVEIKSPVVPLVANVTAAPVTEPDEIRKLLVSQVVGTVRWRETAQFLADNQITKIVELGTGKVLAGLVRRTHRAFTVASIATPDDIAPGLELLQS
ncbi:MAG: ACP S-malonyltransferase [Pseudomonadota bacterium]